MIVTEKHRDAAKQETLTEKRVDAVTQIIYDPSGKQSGEYYPANATHFFGKPIKRKKASC